MTRNRRTGSDSGDASAKRSTKWGEVILLGFIGALVGLGLFMVYRATASSRYVPEVEGNPSLQVGAAELDLGDVRLGKFVNASFELKNVGDTPLRFSREPWVTAVAGC